MTALELQQVNVDTMVQEKNITPPTDSKLLSTAIAKLAKAARCRGLRLHQTYTRVAQRAAIQTSRYAYAKQFLRMRRLRTWLGRVLRDIRRQQPAGDEHLESLLILCERLHRQQPTDSRKLYSLHEPDVVCISKGTAYKRYEFGQKIALATSNRRNWIVGIELCPGNPYDGHTLSATLQSLTRTTGVDVQAAFVDKGRPRSRSRDQPPRWQQFSRLTRTVRSRRKPRSAIEPKTGHLKSDHCRGPCFLKGLPGDALNAVLAAAGSNLRQLLRPLFFVPALLRWLVAMTRQNHNPRLEPISNQN